MPSGFLGQVDFPMGQVTFQVHLPNGQRPRKVICQSSHKQGTGFVLVLENLESPGILLWHFLGLESPGERLLFLDSSGNLLNSNKRYEMYGRQ